MAGFDWSSFASGTFGAVLGATTTFGSGWLGRREGRHAAQAERISTFIERVEAVALSVRRLPHPVTTLPDEQALLFGQAFVAMGAIGFRNRRSDRAVSRWVAEYLHQIVFEPTGSDEIADAALIASKLQEWHTGSQRFEWFERHMPGGGAFDPSKPRRWSRRR